MSHIYFARPEVRRFLSRNKPHRGDSLVVLVALIILWVLLSSVYWSSVIFAAICSVVIVESHNKVIKAIAVFLIVTVSFASGHYFWDY